MYTGITIIGIIILSTIVYFLIKFHYKRQLTKLQRGYNKDDNKSKQTGAKIDSENIGYRTTEGTSRSSGEEQYLEPASEPERRVLLPNDVIVDDGTGNNRIREDSNSTPTNRKSSRGIFGRRRRNK